MDKNSFILYSEYSEYFDMLSLEEAGKLIMAIFRYADTGEIAELEGMSKMAFSFIKNQMDRDCEKWETTVKKRKEAGKKGSDKRWKADDDSKAINEDGKNSNAINEDSKNGKAINEMAKIADNVDVNENVNVYVNDNVNEDVNDNVLRPKKEESFISLYPKENYSSEADRYDAMFAAIDEKWKKRRQEKCRGA